MSWELGGGEVATCRWCGREGEVVPQQQENLQLTSIVAITSIDATVRPNVRRTVHLCWECLQAQSLIEEICERVCGVCYDVVRKQVMAAWLRNGRSLTVGQVVEIARSVERGN